VGVTLERLLHHVDALPGAEKTADIPPREDERLVRRTGLCVLSHGAVGRAGGVAHAAAQYYYHN
jgi:hypothetical protein